MDAHREYVEALLDGDAGDQDWPGVRRGGYDMVACWPVDRLDELVSMTPPERRDALIAELNRRRVDVRIEVNR